MRISLNKNIKLFINYFLGPALFLWLSFSIYITISKQQNLYTSWEKIVESFHTPKIFFLITAFLLMFVNWGIETLKWKTAIKNVQQLSFWTAFKAVLSGTSFSLGTPNRVGEYLGRIMYMEEGKRLKTISLTIVGSISQIIVTLSLGVIGLLILKNKISSSQIIETLWIKGIIWGTILVVVIMLVFYFRLPWLIKIIDRLPILAKYSYLINTLELFNTTLLLKLLSLSFIRHLVFSFQYFLVFHFFDVSVGIATIFWVINVMFLCLAIFPTISIAELGLRGEISLRLMGMFSANSLGIGLATGFVWFLNLVLPAILGSVFILGIKLFKK